MVDLRLTLLGPPLVQRAAAPVSFDTRKAVALLALLAVTGREHSRDELASLLWPDSDNVRSRASLRRTLSVTSAATGAALTITRSAVSLTPQVVGVDVVDFQDLVQRGDTSSLEQAVHLYRGDFLAGFTVRGCPGFEDWQVSVADRLRQQLGQALERLVEARLVTGHLADALRHARRWLDLDPLNEPAHQAMIKILAWSGDRTAALRQYRTLVRILDRELAVRPLPQTTRLYDGVRSGQLGGAPARTRTADAGPGSSPESVSTAGALDRATPSVRSGRAPAVRTARSASPLVGRSTELEALRSARSAVRTDGRAVAVVGPSGCGKSRLVEEYCAETVAAGGLVLAVRAHDGESALPFAVTGDLLRSALLSSPDLPGRLPAHTAAIAARLTPELGSLRPATDSLTLDSPMALTRLYRAVAETLVAASIPGRPTTVVIDDVHWADGPSLDMLAYLLRRLAGWPVLLVLTWSAEHADRLRNLQTALGEAFDDQDAVLVEPGHLTARDVEALLAAAGLPGADVPRLLAETRGLPLLVHEYLEALKVATTADDQWWPPASLRELLRRRVASASEPTSQLLSTAAVLGSGCDGDLLRTVSGRGETETVEAIEEALTRSLLTELPAGGTSRAPTYAFPYEALRRVVYDCATLARRRLLHARAADALTRRYEQDPDTTSAATIAVHLQSCGRDDDAAQWWWHAATRARNLYAHLDAHAHLRKAQALGYSSTETAVALGDVLTLLGRYGEALAEFESAAAVTDDETYLAAIEHKLAEVHHRLGDWALADAHLASALDLLPPKEVALRARVSADQAVIAYRRRDLPRATTVAREALSAAQKVDDPEVTAQALNVLGMIASRRSRPDDAERDLRESLSHAQRLTHHRATIAALNNLARLLADQGRAGEALELARTALDLGSQLGDQHRVAALHTNLADLLHATGQADAAVEHLKQAARRFAGVDSAGNLRPEIWTLVEW